MSKRPRRWDIEGRVCCLYCHILLRSGKPSLVNHYKAAGHFVPVVRYRKPDIIARNGRPFCRQRNPPKVIYATMTDAILGSMLVFIERGFILEPYLCGDYEVRWTDLFMHTHKSKTKVDGTGYYAGKKYNWLKGLEVRSRTKILRGCGRWHLSKRVLRLAA